MHCSSPGGGWLRAGALPVALERATAGWQSGSGSVLAADIRATTSAMPTNSSGPARCTAFSHRSSAAFAAAAAMSTAASAATPRSDTPAMICRSARPRATRETEAGSEAEARESRGRPCLAAGSLAPGDKVDREMTSPIGCDAGMCRGCQLNLGLVHIVPCTVCVQHQSSGRCSSARPPPPLPP